MGEFPLLAEFEKELGPQGLTIVGVSVDKECDRARSMVQHFNVNWPQLCDGMGLAGPIAQDYLVEATPAYFVIAADGTMVGNTTAGEGLASLLASALHGTPQDGAGGDR